MRSLKTFHVILIPLTDKLIFSSLTRTYLCEKRRANFEQSLVPTILFCGALVFSDLFVCTKKHLFVITFIKKQYFNLCKIRNTAIFQKYETIYYYFLLIRKVRTLLFDLITN